LTGRVSAVSRKASPSASLSLASGSITTGCPADTALSVAATGGAFARATSGDPA
jgi:hypothetical protein